MQILIKEHQLDTILLSEHYDFKLIMSNKQSYRYSFVNKDNYKFVVEFDDIDHNIGDKTYKGFERSYVVNVNNDDTPGTFKEINTGDSFKIISTITNITKHFIDNIKPDFIKIYHLPSKKDVLRTKQTFYGGRLPFNYTEDVSQRALLNKRFLEKVIDDEYIYLLKGSISFIIRKDSGMLEDNYFKQHLMENIKFSKLDSRDNTYTFLLDNIRFNVQFKKDATYQGLNAFTRSYYVGNSASFGFDPFEEINKNKPFTVVKAITDITIKFLQEKNPDLLIIKHIYKQKNDLNTKGKTPDERNTNQRALLNKRFLERYLPSDYQYYLVGINSIIIKKDQEVLKKVANQNIYGISSKIDSLLTESSSYYDSLEKRLKEMGFSDEKELKMLIDLAKNGSLGEYLQTQGKLFTFGLLSAIFADALAAKRKIELRSGVIKMAHRLIPMALAFKYPIAAIIGYILGTSRAFNKVIAPILADPGKSYPEFLKKLILSTMKVAEGEFVEFEDHFSKAFVVSDDITKILNPEILHKFALYLSEKMMKENSNKEVPAFYIENELRKYLNRIYELNPPLPLKSQQV